MLPSRTAADSKEPVPHVLVVDDESSVRGLLSRWLTDAGYICSQARDPDEALEVLRDNQIDAVTLDVRMPLGSGLDVVHRIAKEFPHVAILMATAVDDAQHAVTALTQGACDYLIKPLDREMFLWRVRRALMGRKRSNTAARSEDVSTTPANHSIEHFRPRPALASVGPNYLARPQFAVTEN